MSTPGFAACILRGCWLPSTNHFAWGVLVKHQQPPALRNSIPCKKQKHEEPLSPAEVARGEIKKHEEQIAWLQADVLQLEEVQTLLLQHSAQSNLKEAIWIFSDTLSFHCTLWLCTYIDILNL